MRVTRSNSLNLSCKSSMTDSQKEVLEGLTVRAHRLADNPMVKSLFTASVNISKIVGMDLPYVYAKT